MRRTSPFAGTRILTRSGLRQNVWFVLPWIAFVLMLTVASYAAFATAFPDAASRAAFSTVLASNPAFSLLMGTVSDISTATGFTVWRAQVLGELAGALMAVLLITRLTRAAEDTGRAELIAAAPVGRHARLVSAGLILLISALLMGGLNTGALLASGMDATVSVVLGICFAAAIVVFGGVAAVTAQLGSFSRTANTLALSVVGAAYLIRGYADAAANSQGLRWFSPMGWLEWVSPLTKTNVGPLWLTMALTIVLWAGAFWLSAHRDFGSGIIAARVGPDRWRASATTFALAWRLQRSTVIVWAAAFIAMSTMFGFVSTSIGDIFAQDPTLSRFFSAGMGSAATLTTAFVFTLISMLTIFATIFGVQSALRLWGEEADGRLELPLSGSLSKWRLYASHATIALIAPSVVLLAGSTVVGMIVVVSNATAGALTVGDIAMQGLASLPFLNVITALTLALIGFAPKLRVLGWIAIVAEFTLTLLGPMLNVPDWALKLSPLYFIPQVSAADADYSSVLWFSVATAALVALGSLTYRRRDLQ